ncbi:16S rRNA (uracil(1498)-N(3))-methyltransferase [Roseobacter sinensis]|uniref:Ribosomal RNA small subunit methyltransferase E n=1 Tax=Roseobacter sinensis TaxID=2931391 RepID=A0ABT3BAY7_9RHOB|nr:16S rRNA (uracil(1498)-N(3))-methyltransferase [Roseobacter sp. WL0113]MCV3270739.1 16S rRNA (uracil(1498)-N(3))-methyltransferase [Roseobacter sp. WL0113]
MTAKIRLFVEHALGAGQSVPVSREQAHYLFGVMRLGAGAQILVFDGQSGEWLAEVAEAGKRGGVLSVLSQTRALQMPPDLWLMFAPVKKARTDFIVEKAVEMGAARILPVQTEFTNTGRVQRARLQAHAVEAAEQCGATYVPQVAEMQRLDRVLGAWDADRQIMFCDEAQAASKPTLPAVCAPWAILIGPEGGFAEGERGRLRRMAQAHPVSLGPRILRAETAAVAALALWQQSLGDWV